MSSILLFSSKQSLSYFISLSLKCQKGTPVLIYSRRKGKYVDFDKVSRLHMTFLVVPLFHFFMKTEKLFWLRMKMMMFYFELHV